MSSLDTLLAALRSTLADPPQIVGEAERELAALRAEVIASRYHYGSRWDDHEWEYLGTVQELPGLSWFAETRDKAQSGMRVVVESCVRDMLRNGETPPPPRGAHV